MANFNKTDLLFILEQIRVAEAHAAGAALTDLLPTPEVPFGLRTVDGSYNNLVQGRTDFGMADLVFPRLVAPVFRPAEGVAAGFFGPGSPAVASSSYQQTSGNVFDSQPRTISNLIVDQTASNPAAVAAALATPGSSVVLSPGLDGEFGTADDRTVNFIPNITADAGLSAPFNSWMTFFGQFFDHGLDLVTKGGNGTIFIPLKPDDPLYVPGGNANFMVLTRATQVDSPGADGVLLDDPNTAVDETADNIHEAVNTTSPFVDQNQTYSSHPSHQVFLRAYEIRDIDPGAAVRLAPVATGKLITNRDLGPDGEFGTADDVEIGGMATWKVVKAQARDVLGINLTDADFDNVPLLATDEYGNFTRGPNGFPQVVFAGNVLLEGNPAANGGNGISLAGAVRTGHAFLNDIAHSAVPVGDHDGNPATPAQLLTPDADTVPGGAAPALGTYDNELLDAHYIAGDGRVNENIGLTAVHAIFHSEHNRLVEQTKAMVRAELAAGDTAFAQEWVVAGAVLTNGIQENEWNGERLFQAAKVGTEMQYQHLVFEEFARTVQPNVDAFVDFDDTLNPAIVAEFAHTVYRFGHSMLTETIDRLSPTFQNSEIGLIEAFLNPLAFAASGPTPEQAAGAIVRGVTRQVGNEIDEFVTEAVRNNLLGLPLDLPAINIARGRDTGVPTLNAARREFYAGTGDSQLKPYTSWADFVQYMKHPESLINFIAAYGTHSGLTAADVDTTAEKRAVATALVMGGSATINAGNVGGPQRTFTAIEADRLEFLNSTGQYASLATGVTITGVDAIDLWIGGLAEEKMPFGGMLGSTFNFVFETQLEALQNGDRFYYLHRLAGTNFVHELENNSFAKLVMLNTDATHLPALIFSTPGFTLEVDPTKQYTRLNEPGADGIQGDDPTTLLINEGADDVPGPDGIARNSDPFNGDPLIPLVIRNNPATPGLDANYLQYTGDQHVVLGGTAGNDILISSEGDDTLYGDGGNDRLEGGYGNDDIQGGAGDDIITDMGGDDVIKGDDGNDVIQGGNGLNLIIAGRGHDFVVTGEDSSEVIAGEGNDFILGSPLNVQMAGNEGDDWIETGTQDGAPGDNFDPLGTDSVIGHDVFIGGGGFDEMIGEGGDDIMVGSEGPNKMKGMSGFDWATFKSDAYGVTVDMLVDAFNESPVAPSSATIMNRFAAVEGLSGSALSDVLRGDDTDAAQIAVAGFTGSTLNSTGIGLISGLQAFLGAGVTSFNSGNIIFGGDGSDIIEGRGGDDLIDGDRSLNVRISVRNAANQEIATANGMTGVLTGKSGIFAGTPDTLTLQSAVFAGMVNAGNLQIVREILNPDAAREFDTAVFSGLRANYTVTELANGITTVTDNVGTDGTDRLTNIERLQFADQSMVLTNTPVITNSGPTGLLTITGTVATGQVLTVSAAAVRDADNTVAPTTPAAPVGSITGPVAYYWQVETVPGSGVFTDISAAAGGGVASATGRTFTVTPDLVGLNLRVRAIYQDQHGVLENVVSAATVDVVQGAPVLPAAVLPVEGSTVSTGVHLIRSDLQFILDQIVVAERHAAGDDLLTLLPNSREPMGLRTVDGSYNNLVRGQSEFGASDNIFPRLVPASLNAAENGTSYTQTSGTVVDSQPRTISNLIVDQTARNPAALAAAAGNEGASVVISPGLDGEFGTADDRTVNFIPNITADAGLSAPFNSWMTFFGQFFDHGLDLVSKGGSGTVFIPLKADDPLVAGADGIFGNGDDLPDGQRFMVLTRAANQPGADGVLGTADDIHEHTNTTSPFVDQNQTYSSHPSHQVFLRAYTLNAQGHPVDTGKLIENRTAGADGQLFTGDDVLVGGMATWAVVKAQARAMLGINLTDADLNNVPLLATDAYGNFIPSPTNGMPQVVLANNTLLAGNLAAPVSLANAARTGHAFLDDIAHSANPRSSTGALLAADSGTGIGDDGVAATYDDELLDAHYIAGDGRVNENIGLTAVHAIFHSEHNRLVEHTKDVALKSNDVAFLNQWLDVAVSAIPTTPADIAALDWNGERLFQAAKFGTEMQYQHLVFEEFARTIQPQIDVFMGPTQGYVGAINPAIVAEFAHTVYRFGHSMLTETIDRLAPDFASSEIGLIEAFLNPLAFAGSGGTPDAAVGAIVRGVTRQVGNEIDEFVTEALRNNLLGLPLDLPAINLARGRDAGVPSLNAARRSFHEMTADSQLKPYTSWADFVQYMKHPESLVNFIAAYGTHATVTSTTTLEAKRTAAMNLVFGATGESALITADRLAFLNSTGAYANLATGVTTTGVDAIDLWIGGLAEEKMPFGGMLGSTFNFVFETQLEALQNSDRFYYLNRNAGQNFATELENNSFAKLIMANSNATHLPGLVFQTPGLILEVDQARQFNADVVNNPGADSVLGDDPLTPLIDESLDDIATPTQDPLGGILLTPLVIRNNPATPGTDSNYLRYTGDEHVVLGGTDTPDILIASEGDDTIWGDGGNDTIEGGNGNDLIRGGEGNDIITDMGGDDNIQGGGGDDVIHGGNGINLILGGFGSDFIVNGEDSTETFGGTGNDFILGSNADEQNMGNEGDDWLEGGNLDGSPGDNFDPNGNDLVIGNDVYIGSGLPDIMNAEGGDDIMVGSSGPGDKFLGASGFDWATFKDDPLGVNIDLTIRVVGGPVPAANGLLARFAEVEGLSGSAFNDILRGDDVTAATIVSAGAQGSVLTNIALVNGLQELIGAGVSVFDDGNIILGGAGSDRIEGRGGDDLIDGDAWLNVRIEDTLNTTRIINSLNDIKAEMFAGTMTPGQLRIVREILTTPVGNTDVDTAVFSGVFANYTLGTDALGRRTVTDNTGVDGTDTLRNIEQLQFADQLIALAPLPATGSPAISDTTPTEGQPLTATLGTVADPNGINLATLAFTWQALTAPDVWTTVGTGPTFTPAQAQVNLPLRLVASFNDSLGGAESRISAPTTVVGDLFIGTAANETAIGTAGQDDLRGNGGNDNLIGLAEDDLLDGGAGADTLNGGAGNDSMTGGAGNDTYLVDAAGDVVTEGLGAGIDTVQSSINYTLGANLENLTLTGAAISGTGNGLNNVLTGTAAANALSGDAGNDTLIGAGGNDSLAGGAGNDSLDGGTGNDSMNGGAGNDVYVVDSAADVVSEVGGTGTDTVQSSVTHTLLAGFENLTLTGGAANNINGTGNAVANVMIGNGGNNVLLGAGGNDTLDGGAGNDLLDGGANNDSLDGGAGADTLTGGAGSDILNGGAGADRLIGGAGLDVMNGGAGDDIFVFAAGFNVDTIQGFDADAAGGQDLLDISALSITAANFSAQVSIIDLGPSTFVTINGGGSILFTDVNGTAPNAITISDFILA